MNNRNINLALAVSAFTHLFFWYGPWLLYWLEYITLRQVATVTMIGMVTSIIFEVPTGALADLIGKKRTLILAFLFTSVGEFIMVFHPSFIGISFSVFILSVGYSFYSGTMDALLYDTLLTSKQESLYSKVLSWYNAITASATAVASFIGGFMYMVWIGLPFVATGIAKIFALVLTLFIQEPNIDSEKFSVKAFVVQTKKGFHHLFSKNMWQLSLLLISYGAFFTISFELLDDIAVVDFGYSAVQIGVLYAVVTILSVPSALLYEQLAKRFKPFALVGMGAFLLFLNYIISPWINVFWWTGIFVARVLYSPIKNSAITEAINVQTPSSIRSTTISTYELIRRIPYVLLAGQIGAVMETSGVRMFSFYFALLILIIVGPQIFFSHFQVKRK